MQTHFVSRFAVLVLAVCFATHGCGIPLRSGVKPVPIDEVDARGIALVRVQALRHGDRAGSVVELLGEPADRQPSCVPGEVVWRYPVRAWNDMVNSREIVPAVLLRVSFDGSETLIDWGFFDSFTGHRLAVREAVDDASRWFQSLSRSPAPIPPHVALNEALVRGQTKAFEVDRILGQWQPDFFCGGGGLVPVVRKTRTDSGSVWEWYVDRPSPLFVPPHYLVVSLTDTGAFLVWHLEQTYPGGRK